MVPQKLACCGRFRGPYCLYHQGWSEKRREVAGSYRDHLEYGFISGSDWPIPNAGAFITAHPRDDCAPPRCVFSHRLTLVSFREVQKNTFLEAVQWNRSKLISIALEAKMVRSSCRASRPSSKLSCFVFQRSRVRIMVMSFFVIFSISRQIIPLLFLCQWMGWADEVGSAVSHEPTWQMRKAGFLLRVFHTYGKKW
jgi:hypothetical protein